MDRVAEVLVPDFVLDVVAGDEDLRDDMVEIAEQFVIDIHEFALADRGCRLLAGDVVRLLGERELADAHADGAGGDEDDVVPGVFEVRQHPAKFRDSPDVQIPGAVCQCRGPDFDYDAQRDPTFLRCFHIETYYKTSPFELSIQRGVPFA